MTPLHGDPAFDEALAAHEREVERQRRAVLAQLAEAEAETAVAAGAS